MKRGRDPSKPRRKWKASGSPGRQILASNRRRLVHIDANEGILEQARAVIEGRKRGRRE